MGIESMLRRWEKGEFPLSQIIVGVILLNILIIYKLYIHF
jgi:hypothetical protein